MSVKRSGPATRHQSPPPQRVITHYLKHYQKGREDHTPPGEAMDRRKDTARAAAKDAQARQPEIGDLWATWSFATDLERLCKMMEGLQRENGAPRPTSEGNEQAEAPRGSNRHALLDHDATTRCANPERTWGTLPCYMSDKEIEAALRESEEEDSLTTTRAVWRYPTDGTGETVDAYRESTGPNNEWEQWTQTPRTTQTTDDVGPGREGTDDDEERARSDSVFTFSDWVNWTPPPPL
ncbi:hypothetical protein CALCODRAFT_508761 [Calocera cornea HHB12733]|uniref:Uncharacterized protein n=1 Tax=Calocera cornea HHB12733 TaxID=1353952 RepID=A0A165G3Q5_9BASI|nr:hypothetical protein CALCODRAFT_508761 [Calocera cornea HHB12733]